MKWDNKEDRIEFQGTALVNAQRQGKCSWCGHITIWYDIILREFLCSSECTMRRHIEVSELRLKQYGT